MVLLTQVPDADVDAVAGELLLVWEIGDAQRAARLRARGESDDVIDDADRKSTRLNSSHVAISYAVFCLKKKKEKELELKRACERRLDRHMENRGRKQE